MPRLSLPPALAFFACLAAFAPADSARAGAGAGAPAWPLFCPNPETPAARETADRLCAALAEALGGLPVTHERPAGRALLLELTDIRPNFLTARLGWQDGDRAGGSPLLSLSVQDRPTLPPRALTDFAAQLIAQADLPAALRAPSR